MHVVLVVEDDRALCRALVRAISAEAAAVGVHDAATALHALDTMRFDAVLADVDLGAGGCGIDLAAEVAARWPRVRFHLMSGTTHRAMPHILTKPLSPHDLASVMGVVEPTAKR